MNWIKEKISVIMSILALISALSSLFFYAWSFVNDIKSSIKRIERLSTMNYASNLIFQKERMEERYETTDPGKMLPEDREKYRSWSRWLDNYQDKSLPEMR